MPEETPDLFEIMRTTRSMRRLRPDPVPAELIRKILEAGVSAPSGGNMQRWRFLVIRDPNVKETIGAYYKRAWDEVVSPRYRAGEPPPGTSRERFLRTLDAVQYLADHIHEAPLWIVPCLEGANPTRTSGSSIYPAVQNMLLAARALCLGATLTTLYLSFEKEVEAALGLPPDVHSMRYCQSVIRWVVSDQFAAYHLPRSSTKTDGVSRCRKGVTNGRFDLPATDRDHARAAREKAGAVAQAWLAPIAVGCLSAAGVLYSSVRRGGATMRERPRSVCIFMPEGG
jgi:nitroreductase